MYNLKQTETDGNIHFIPIIIMQSRLAGHHNKVRELFDTEGW